MASIVAPSQAHKESPGAKIQQLFEDAQLPDISLRPDSAACATTRPSRSLSQSGNPVNTSKLTFPLTPQQAIEKFRRTLTMFELEEIHQYPQIYFVGPLAKKVAAREDAGCNAGYDDDKGRYKLIKNDHIGYRFEVLKGLGRGSFGEVVRTFDHKTQQHYALKIIRNERRFHKQGQIEVKILEHLRKEDRRNQYNIIHFKEWFVFRNHICITFELLHIDLYTALKNDSFRGFGIAQVQNFAFNMLVCLRVLHKSHLIHCDLKPENILLCRKDSTDIKVIDFGSACFDTQRVHTYIQSRFYRSPEIILGGNYGMPIDMWSLGCILVELATGQPLFPGHDEKEQLLLQMEVLGLPASSLLEKAKRFSIFFDSTCQPRVTHDTKGRARVPSSRPLTKVLGRSEPDFEDFVLRCLRWDPDDRMTPRDALRHPFVAGPAAASKAKRTASEGGTSAAGTTQQDDDIVDGMEALSLTATTRTLGAAIIPLAGTTAASVFAPVPGLASSLGLGNTYSGTQASSAGVGAMPPLSMTTRTLLPPVGHTTSAAAATTTTTFTAQPPARHPSTASTSSANFPSAGITMLPPPPIPPPGTRTSGPLPSYAASGATYFGGGALGGGGGSMHGASAVIPPPSASSISLSSNTSTAATTNHIAPHPPTTTTTTTATGTPPAAGPAGVGGPAIMRRPSLTRLTTDQQAHAERVRATVNVNGSPGTTTGLPAVSSTIGRRPSLPRG